MKKLLLLTGALAMLTMQVLTAQVSVGSLEPPVPGSLLQLKTINDDVSKGDFNATKGLGLPRVVLVKKNELQPMYTALEAAALTADQKMAHKGLIVYNLTEDDNEGLALGLNFWDGEKWTSLQNAKGNAIAQILCSQIKVYGNYVRGKQTTPQEVISIPVDVSKIGVYSIIVNAMKGGASNGYSFSGSGEFLFPGTQIVTLTAQGSPTEDDYSSTDPSVGDTIQILFNGNPIALPCSNVVIPVTPPLADYTLYCGSAVVYGVYTVAPDPRPADTPDNYIQLDVNVSSLTSGSSWSATTDKKSGISFHGAGIFDNTGRQTIILYADPGSKPTTYNPIQLTITAETMNGETTCDVTVRAAYPRKKIMGMGDNTLYGYEGQAGASRRLLSSSANFGSDLTSTVPMITSGSTGAALPAIPTNTNATIGTTYNYNAFDYTYLGAFSEANLQYAITNKIDIVILGFPHTWTDAAAKIALQYLSLGGIILDFCESTSASYMLNAIFGLPTATGVIGSADGTPMYAPMANFPDPILNGPFQPEGSTSLGGFNLGGDTENRLYGFKNIPPSGIIVYAYTGAGNPVALRTTGQRYILFGEGGFLANNDSGDIKANDNSNIEPFATTHDLDKNDLTYRPAPRPASAIGTYYAVPIYNSYFFANAIAWAIDQAQFYGINTK